MKQREFQRWLQRQGRRNTTGQKSLKTLFQRKTKCDASTPKQGNRHSFTPSYYQTIGT